MNISVVFSPAELDQLRNKDLSQTTCIVFDVLRATSTMLAAFANGATAIKPVAEISEAVKERKKDPNVILAGERDGIRIGADLSDGIAFDLGNSPREMDAENVCGKTLISTTTNGTRAIRACVGAKHVFVASFGNLTAVANRVVDLPAKDILLVCSGTGENACLEDSCAAGALTQMLITLVETSTLSDSAIMAFHVYSQVKDSLFAGISDASNARRLLAMPSLADDVEWCLKMDQFTLVPALNREGYLTCS